MTQTHVLHRSLTANYPTAVKGEGVYLYDASGKQYLDACGGAAVCCLGYSNQRVRNAIHVQVDKLAYIHSSFFTTDVMEEFADLLISQNSDNFDKVYFVSGGSEAVESAIKMARQYFVEKGEPQRKHIIARKQSYHGNTLGALSAGGNLWRKQLFDPILLESHFVSAAYPYRHQQDDETEDEYAQRLANELENKILELGSNQVMAFMAEPVVGATAGALTPPSGYFKRIREICDKYGILLILDEVMCGMGRTGTLHAWEQEGIHADIQTVAKGIAAGYQPLGAVFIDKKITDIIAAGSGFFQHGHTYIGHATACAAGLATQKEVQEKHLLDNVQNRGKQLIALLRQEFAEHPHVGDIRGRGFFIGLEFVKNKMDKSPFPREQAIHKHIKQQAMELGLMCYPMGGTIDGQHGDHVLLAPPYIYTDAHIDELMDKLKRTLDITFNTPLQQTA